MKRLIGIIMLLMLTVSVSGAQTTTTVNVTWTAPAVDATHSAPVAYILRWRIVGAPAWTIFAPNPTTTTATLTIPTAVAVECEVSAIDAQGHQGDWSPTSDPYTWKRPNGCGKPVWN